MATLSEIRSDIADEINRTDLNSQIDVCINAAIEEGSSERLSFNQATVTGTLTADSSTLALPSQFFALKLFRVTANGTIYTLENRGLDIIENWRDSGSDSGEPLFYAIWNDNFELYPTPNDAYSYRITYWQDYTELTADGDNNAWTNNAERYVKLKAKSVLYGDYLRISDDANFYESRAQRELFRLRNKYNREEGGYALALND